MRASARPATTRLDVELFRRRAFSQSIATNSLAAFAVTGFAIFTTGYLQSVVGMSPLRAALWSMLPAQSLGGATFVAGQLPPDVGAHLLTAARESFAGGLHAAALTAALLLLAAAVTTVAFRRRFGPLEPTEAIEPESRSDVDERMTA